MSVRFRPRRVAAKLQEIAEGLKRTKVEVQTDAMLVVAAPFNKSAYRNREPKLRENIYCSRKSA
jgi:hypothetical protein